MFFANSLQETGENTKQWLTVRHQTEVSDRRVVLRSQVPETHGQDPRIGNHHSLYEAEESCWFRWVYFLASFVTSTYSISPQVSLCGQTYFYYPTDVCFLPMSIKYLPSVKPPLPVPAGSTWHLQGGRTQKSVTLWENIGFKCWFHPGQTVYPSEQTNCGITV